MTKTKKVRKPTYKHSLDEGDWDCGDSFVNIDVWTSNIKTAKKLHKWLGQAIAYLEQTKEKK